MRRYFSSCILLSIFSLNCFAQRIDRAPSGKVNYLPVEGGSIRMHIDSTTSLRDLLKRLSGKWDFIETGKMYWIGYTNDMFSIAARGDSAITPLVSLVENSKSEHARLGAIYTIHLIGIQRKIIGRFEEKFVDTNARKALIYLLKYPDFQPAIMELLMRDPWKFDVPELIACLKNTDSDCWAVVSGLNRYEPGNPPLKQKIPGNLGNIRIKLRYSNPAVLEPDFDFEGQIQEILDSLISLKNDSIIVERDLLGQPLCGNLRTKFGNANSGDHFLQLTVGEFLDPWSSTVFGQLGNKYQYYIDNGKVYICSAHTAKKRWIEWAATGK